jgi:hypothetical protein
VCVVRHPRAPVPRFARLTHPIRGDGARGKAALRRLRRSTALLITCGLAAALIAGCGGDGGGSDADPQQLLDQTFGSDAEIKSGVLDLSLDGEGTGEAGGSLSGKLSGPFESKGPEQLPELDLSLSLQAGGAGEGIDFDGGLTITEDAAFITVGGTAYQVDEATFKSFKDLYAQSAQTQQADGEQGAALFSRLGIDPASWLTDVTNEGTEEVGGTETVHISGNADIGRIVKDAQNLAENAPGGAGGLDAGQLGQLQDAVKSARVDVYTGADDHILRRLDLTLELEDPDSGNSLNLSLSVGFSDVNESQEISAPEDARPLEELVPGGLGDLSGLGALGGLGGLEGLGGAGGGGGSGGGAGGGAGGGGSGGTPSLGDLEGVNRDYVKCVKAAGTPEEILDCARLLE